MTGLPFAQARAAFSADLAREPALTLRGGNALDEYREPPPFDRAFDVVCDAYLEQHYWGVGYLDPESWRHYLPALMDYALRRRAQSSAVIEALLESLRPPDRVPPRLESLTAAQAKIVGEFLDVMAFDESSVHQDLAQKAIEEWWGPGALYRLAGPRR